MGKDMKFRTTVECGMPGLAISPGHQVTLLGSCFADHVGRRMSASGLDVHVNPFGVLYNPLSISTMCMSLTLEGEFPDDCFFESGGMWHSWLNDSSFSATGREACRARLEAARRAEKARLQTLDFLFLTLGTNRYYALKEGGRAVGNCHKQPDCLFVERQMDVDEAMTALGRALEALWGVNPALQVVFTVSPYRYAKYGFHGSQLGKAVLLLAVEGLCRRFSGRCHYFPAYEIVLDELRDYRFYADDMLHPSELAVAYVWERFSDSCLAPETRAFMAEWEAVGKALAHRPLHPESEAYRNFLRQTMLKLQRLTEKYPKLASTPEYERLESLLKD